MSISTQLYFDLASLAEASYAKFVDFESVKEALVAEGLSAAQADDLLSRWSLVPDTHNAGAGYSSTLFESADEFVLAFRGTSEPIDDGLNADLMDIVADGIAIHQIIDMVNEWSRLNASGIYSIAKFETLTLETIGLIAAEGLGEGAKLAYLETLKLRDDVIVDIGSNTVKTIVWENSTANGLGLAAEIAAKGLTVTGHSLGGHLAAAFTRLIPDVGADAFTINGAGFGVLGLNGFASKNVSNLFALLFGETEFNITSVLNLYGDKNWEFVTQDALLPQPGNSLPVFIEQPTIWGNTFGHGIEQMVDSLAVYDLFFRMDKNAPLNELLKIFNEANNKAEKSLESIVGLLVKLFNVDVALVAGNRESLHKSIQLIRENNTFIQVADRIEVLSRPDVSLAKSDFNHFLSLYYSLPFVLLDAESVLQGLQGDLYSHWTADQSLSAEDRKNAKANFSDEWYQDRANFLSILLDRNANDIDSSESANPSGNDIFYVNVEGFDSGSGRIFSGDVNAGNINQEPAPSRIVFGTNSDNTPANTGADGFVGGNGNDRIYGLGGDDKLNGLKGNDELYGGTGDDELTGGEGHDILLGGEGNDTYIFEGNFGNDRVIDSDGNGSITINGVTVSSLKPVRGAENVFRVNDEIEAVLFNDGASNNLLIVARTNSTTNSILIKNWIENNLGIGIAEQEIEEIDSNTTGVFNGDTNDNAIDIYDFRKTLPEGTDSSAIINLVSNGGGGRDLLQGWLSGSDTLDGGDGDDFIIGGNQINGSGTYVLDYVDLQGTDMLSGGAGYDYIVVSGKNSVAHGGTGNDFIRADELWNIEIREYEADGGVSSTDSYDVDKNQVWADFSRFLSPNYSETSPGIHSLSVFDHSQTSLNWVRETSVTGLPYYYLQRARNSSSNRIFATIYYGDSAPDFGTHPISGEWTIESGVQVDFIFNSVLEYQIAPEDYAAYQNQTGVYLYGDDGEDVIYGGIKSDYIFGGADKDTIWALGGHDFIDGGSGSDDIFAGDGNDIVMGGAGEDSLRGGDGNDYLNGGDDNVKDILSGGKGNDTIVVGRLDHVSGAEGDDIYIWDQHQITTSTPEVQPVTINENGSASNSSYADIMVTNTSLASEENSYIIDNKGNNTLAFVGEQDFSNFSIDKSATHLILNTGDNQQLILQDALVNASMNIITGSSVEALAAGTVQVKAITDDTFLSGANLISGQQVSTTALMLSNLQRAVNVTAAVSNTYLAGGLLDDTLMGHIDGSRFIGGKGSDTLIGNIGNDIYLIREGDGHDIITDTGGNNTLKLDKNISINQLRVNRVGADLLIGISDEQTILVSNMFDVTTGALIVENAVQKINFYDATVWDIEAIKQRALTGSAGNDVIGGFETNDILVGGNGNDQINDQAGDDVYRYALGDGNDVITDAGGNDCIELSGGILTDQVIAFRDVYNNLILKFPNGEKLTIAGAFDTSGNFTAQTVETIQFSDASTWDAARILQEVAAHTPQNISGTDDDDLLLGDAVSDFFIGNKGDDHILGDAGNDIYRYALGDGKDVIIDTAGVDRIELSGITQDQLIARSNGRDLVFSFTDGGSLTVTDMFVSKSQTQVDPLITQIVNELQTNWISQAETLIEKHYGVVGNGEITLNFERNGTAGVNRAHVEVLQAGGNNNPTKLILSINLDAFEVMPNGSGPWYHDRGIAHEMVHAVMASNMSLSGMPGWFLEGTAELIQGGDERVRNEMGIIGNQNNFNLLFKTTAGSPTTNAGYAVSYIAVKFLDKEIRDNGGIGIKELFDELQAGKSLDQALVTVSLAHNEMNGRWNDLVSFETYFKSVGFASIDTILNLNNADTGSIAGSDYGFEALDANSVISNIHIGSSQHFTVVVPDEYINSVGVHNEVESIHFSDGTVWNTERIQEEVVKGNLIDRDDVIFGTQGNDTLIGTDANDVFVDESGDDTYIYKLGNGNDVIIDSAGNDSIRLGLNSWSSDYSLNRDASNNLVIMFSDGGDIVVKNAFALNAGAYSTTVEKIDFQDGIVIDVSEMNLQVAQGRELWANGNNFVRLIGTTNADTLHGGIGSDKLVGGFGNDRLISGGGNDSMYGGSGDDIYEFNGSGASIVTDTAGADTLHILAADPAITKLYQSSTDLIVYFDAQSRITVTDYFDLQGNVSEKAIEKIVFANGTAWDSSYIQQHIRIADGSILNGTYQNDRIDGGVGNDSIYGFDGYDSLFGYEGADTLVAGKGNDNIFGGSGDDTYVLRPGDGDDLIYESGGKNVIQLEDYIETDESSNIVYVEHIAEADVRLKKEYGTQFRLVTNHGASVLLIDMFDNTTGALKNNQAIHAIRFANGVEWDYARMQQEMLRYTDGNDSIEGFDSNNNLYGGKGSDSLRGTSFDDNLNGGQGADYLYGQGGNDTYHYALGDGTDVIYESSGIDTLELGAGIDPTDVYVSIDSQKSAIVLMLPGIGRVTFASMLDATNLQLNDAGTVEFIKFHTGETWTAKQLLDKARSFESVVIQGDALSNTLEGTSSSDLIVGGKGSDTISGSDGDDQYAFSSSDFFEHSNDWIKGFDNGFDSVKFTSGITEENIQVRFSVGVSNQGYLRIALAGHEISGAIYVDGMYSGGSVGLGIEQIDFANGNSWDLERIKAEAIKPTDGDDVIYAYNSNDMLSGGKGNDDLAGQGGNDTYIFNMGYGDDQILDSGGNDSLLLGEGISSDNIIVRRTGSFAAEHLELRVNDDDAITIIKALNSSGSVNAYNVIESINFASGEVWGISRLLAESIKGSAKSDVIYGYESNDVIRGGKGYDQMYGYGGNDTYQFGIGDEMGIIIESGGNDTVEFLSGISPNDIIIGRSGTNLVIHTASGDEVKVQGMFTSSGGIVSSKAIEAIKFADTTLWDTAKILQEVSLTASNTAIKLGSDNNDTLTGGAGNDLIYGENGNDILRGMGGDDTLVSGTGRDTLFGNNGNDLLISSRNPGGLSGFDGGLGDDTYLIQLESGETIITEGMEGNGTSNYARYTIAGGFDLIKLPTGVTEQDVSIRVSPANYGSDLTRTLEISLSNGDAIMVRGMFQQSTGWEHQNFSGQLDSIGVIEAIRFDNNIEWDINRILEEAIKGSNSADHISGFNTAELFASLEGNDTVYSGGGNDTLIGGEGDDLLIDRQGNEAYRFSRGDGKDTIEDSNGNDSIYFEGDIALADISAKRSDLSWGEPNNQMGESLIISLNTGESIEIMGVFSAGLNAVNENAVIENVYFENDSPIAFSALLNSISGFEVDTIPPDIPTAVIDSLGTTISGVSEVGSFVTAKDADGNILGIATADSASGTYSLLLTTPLINKELVNITAQDASGNISEVKAIFAPDKTRPATPTASLDAAGQVVNGFAEPGSSVMVQVVTGQTLGSAQADTITGAYSITLTTALINNETINVTAKDAAGNVSEILTIIAPDKIAPALPAASFDTTGKVISGVAEAGSVVVVKNANNSSTLGTVTAHATTGVYSITLMSALVNREIVNITATDVAGNVSVARALVAPEVASPNPSSIVIQAESYTSMRGVQKEVTTDIGGGQNVGYIEAGDWMAYKNVIFNVPAEGRYRVTYRIASPNGGGRLTLKELRNDAALGSISVPKTSAWQNWVDVTQEITLSGGQHNFKLAVDIGGFNINWFKLEPVVAVTGLNKVMVGDTDESVFYKNQNAALIQAMAVFESSAGVGSQYPSGYSEQVAIALAVGS